jgi:hypothetical protein
MVFETANINSSSNIRRNSRKSRFWQSCDAVNKLCPVHMRTKSGHHVSANIYRGLHLNTSTVKYCLKARKKHVERLRRSTSIEFFSASTSPYGLFYSIVITTPSPSPL